MKIPNVFTKRKNKLKLLIGIPLMVLLIQGSDYYYGYEYTPVLLRRTDLENSIKMLEARPITESGKIYIKDSLILVSEKYKGIHIINNIDSVHPKNYGYINIPGCLDMAVKGHYLYADNAVDLITIDLDYLPTIIVTSRIRDVFPEIPMPDVNYIPIAFQKENRPDNTIIVNWIRKYVNE